MFDIGFSELIVIAIVALVVIGPERLPRVARTAGHLLGRMQRYVNDVKADIDREMQIDELKKLQAQMQESARSFENSINAEARALQQTFDAGADAVRQAATGAEAPLACEDATRAAAQLQTAPATPDHAAAGIVLDGPLILFFEGRTPRFRARVTFGRSPKSDQKRCLKPQVSRLPARLGCAENRRRVPRAT